MTDEAQELPIVELHVRLGRVGGWAPGGYINSCIDCGEKFDGDKRAVQCLPCAIVTLSKEHHSPESLQTIREQAATIATIATLTDRLGVMRAAPADAELMAVGWAVSHVPVVGGCTITGIEGHVLGPDEAQAVARAAITAFLNIRAALQSDRTNHE